MTKIWCHTEIKTKKEEKGGMYKCNMKERKRKVKEKKTKTK